MLVGALEVGDAPALTPRARPGVAKSRVQRLERTMRAARVEPHVEDVSFLAERPGLPARGAGEARRQERLDRLLVPGVRPVRPRQLGGPSHDVRVEQRGLAGPAVERRDPHAPGALARQAPVGPQAYRFADAILRR